MAKLRNLSFGVRLAFDKKAEKDLKTIFSKITQPFKSIIKAGSGFKKSTESMATKFNSGIKLVESLLARAEKFANVVEGVAGQAGQFVDLANALETTVDDLVLLNQSFAKQGGDPGKIQELLERYNRAIESGIIENNENVSTTSGFFGLLKQIAKGNIDATDRFKIFGKSNDVFVKKVAGMAEQAAMFYDQADLSAIDTSARAIEYGNDIADQIAGLEYQKMIDMASIIAQNRLGDALLEGRKTAVESEIRALEAQDQASIELSASIRPYIDAKAEQFISVFKAGILDVVTAIQNNENFKFFEGGLFEKEISNTSAFVGLGRGVGTVFSGFGSIFSETADDIAKRANRNKATESLTDVNP